MEMTKENGFFYYVSNAGLVLGEPGRMLGIDVFSSDPSGLYPATPPDVKERLWREIEAGRIKWLIFTHEHRDHFCPEDVREAWRRNPALKVITTEKAAELLTEQGAAEEAVRSIPGFSAQAGHSAGEHPAVWMELGGFRVGFLNSAHEGAQYAGVQNLSLLLETEGRRWVVPGDAAPVRELFERICAWSGRIDCFFLPFPYVGLASNRRKLRDALEIRQIFVLHQPRREADTAGWADRAKAVCEGADDGLPMPVFPDHFGRYALD